MNKYKHGLAVMRCQPVHNGHISLIDRMLEECEKVTIILGSIQEYDTDRNPFTCYRRKEMITNYYKNENRLTVQGVSNIEDREGWAKYVLDCMKREHPDAPPVDIYFCGVEQDSDLFEKESLAIEVIDRGNHISGTEIRKLCKNKDREWKKYVPECNWETVETLEPKEECMSTIENIAEGLKILGKYSSNISCSHHLIQVYYESGNEEFPLTEEETNRLAEMRWSKDYLYEGSKSWGYEV